MKKPIPQNIKNLYHLGQAMLAGFFNGFPSRSIRIIGVTGTNGKTTTVQMITRVLEEAGFRVAAASTIHFQIAEKNWINKTKFTTLSAWGVQKFLRQAVSASCDWVVLEVSSHALDQNRVFGVDFEIAVITNVTREHLDYHRNMEEYRIAKLKLFKKVKKAVVNLDMGKARDYLDCGNDKAKYAFTAQADMDVQKCSLDHDFDCGKVRIVQAEKIKLGISHSFFEVSGKKVELKIPGLFNVENALAALAVAVSENIDLEIAARALGKITGIPGRMEHVSNEKGLDIIVDYAVTPDSLRKMHALIGRIKKENSRVVAVMGACGERDRGKRPIMGKIVSENADFVILTNEDPFGEDPLRIIREVAKGMSGKKEGENYWIIPDRREAIKKALTLTRPGDIFVITGKGAEETMAIGKKRIPWNDRRVILEELKNI